MIEYVSAVKGEARDIKEALPLLCLNTEYIERMLNNSTAIVILAKDKNNIVGVVGGWLKGTPSGYEDEDRILRLHNAYSEAHLDGIAVEEKHREIGLGANWVQKICDWARKNKKKKIGVETAKDEAEFYEKMSFHPIDRFMKEKGETYLTMLEQLLYSCSMF